jgi:hypothetical protein
MSAARITAIGITIMKNTLKPSMVSAWSTVLNGPRAASCTRFHRGMAATMAPPATITV